MEALDLFSDSEPLSLRGHRDSPDSPSPTPSPTPEPYSPSPSHARLTLQSTGSTELESVGAQSPGRGRRGRRGQEEGRSVNRGHWSLQENKRYHWFLEIHYSHFVNRHMRRMDKIFKSMEMFVGTRQAEQCRSHHQKMEKKYLNFTTIISNLRRHHYNSLEIDPLLEEINSFGAHATEGIATIEYLMEQQAIEPPTELKERRKSLYARSEREDRNAKDSRESRDNQVEPEPREQDGERQQEEGVGEERSWEDGCHVNMLEDCSINIGELSLHHREENSPIFNPIFF